MEKWMGSAVSQLVQPWMGVQHSGRGGFRLFGHLGAQSQFLNRFIQLNHVIRTGSNQLEGSHNDETQHFQSKKHLTVKVSMRCTCSINQSIKRRLSLWNFDWVGLLDSYRTICFYGGGAKVTEHRETNTVQRKWGEMKQHSEWNSGKPFVQS